MKPPAEIVHIPVEGRLASLGAAAYLAIVAYPARRDYKYRDRLVEAAKLWILRQAVKEGYPRTSLRPQYQSYRRQQVYRAFRPVTLRIDKRRLPAAAIAQQVVIEAAGRSGPICLRTRTGISSITEAIAFLTRGNRTGNLRHDYERVWLESKPVLHLSMALLDSGTVHREKTTSRHVRAWIDPFELIAKPDWLLPAIRSAEIQRLMLSVLLRNFDLASAIRLLPDNS